MNTPPLQGITVIDCSRVLAGPFATMILSDLGARVIKIESETGDDARAIGPFVNGQSLYFASLNRGKESVTLNLKKDSHRLLFEDMLAAADILIENFRPGVMKRLGYDWLTLHERHEQLIMASISGFGQEGERRAKPAYDIIIQAMSGMMSINGEENTDGVRVGTSIGDMTAGLYGVAGILAALHKRHTTGVGSHVDIAMLDCQVALLENALVRYASDGVVPRPIGNRHPSITPFASFQTSDRPIVIACGNDTLFASLCHALKQPQWLDDTRFATNDQRTHHHHELHRLIESCLATKSAHEWIDILEKNAIPVGLIRTVGEVCDDEHLRTRRMLVSVHDTAAGSITVSGNPIKISNCPDDETRSPPPSLKKPLE